MDLVFNTQIASNYKSNSQKTRVLTEDWVSDHIFCPNCGSKIVNYENNKPVADFFCPNCGEDYELKSKKDSIGNKIVDGAYTAMVKRLVSSKNPNFFFLSYDRHRLEVQNFLVIPKHYFIPAIIEKRKPLPEAAKRAGWVGCNILLKNIPESGRIYYVKNSVSFSKQTVINSWKRTEFLRSENDMVAKGWLLDTMRVIDKLHKSEFRLDEIYAYEKEFSDLHSNNKHIKDKIRQQLQILRDKGYLSFVSRGVYKII